MPPRSSLLRPRALLTIVPLVPALGGCDTRPPANQGSVRDSAGIRIVEHGVAGEELGTWRPGAEPLLDLGRLEGEDAYLFGHVRDAARLADGTLVVLETAAGEVRLFDREGTHLRTLGGQGEGPGEFRSPLRVWPRGDSLVVFDWTGGRITLLPVDGSAARTLQPTGLRRAFNAEAWLAEDRVIVPVKTSAPPMDETGPTEVFVTYVAVPLDGSPPDTVTRIDAGPQERIEVTVGGRTMITADVSPAMFQALPHAATDGPYLWAVSGFRPAVRRFDARGGPDLEIRWHEPGRATTEAMVERYIESRAAASSDPDQIRETFAQYPVADSLAYLDDLLVDERRRLWVKRTRVAPEDGLDHWTVYGPSGARVARAELPAELTVFRIGEDWILGMREDDLDVPHVVLLPLEKGESP